jgi:hypothetical protein
MRSMSVKAQPPVLGVILGEERLHVAVLVGLDLWLRERAAGLLGSMAASLFLFRELNVVMLTPYFSDTASRVTPPSWSAIACALVSSVLIWGQILM